MKRIMGRVFAFCLILAALLAVASLLLQPKEDTAEAGFLEPEAGAVLAEPENTLDVVFLGDSTVRYGVRPLRIWREAGITSYNCATNAQKLYETEEYLSVTLQRQSPKLVMLEANIFFTPQTELETAASYAERIFPVLRYHDRWKTLQPQELAAQRHYTHRETERGYILREEVAPCGGMQYTGKTDETVSLADSNLASIRRIAAQCSSRDIPLVLVYLPTADSWDYYRHNTVVALAEELGVACIDLNLTDEVGINWQTDTFDYGIHLNVSGADKVSVYLADYLTQTGLFTDKRGDKSFADWATAAQEALEPQEEA